MNVFGIKSLINKKCRENFKWTTKFNAWMERFLEAIFENDVSSISIGCKHFRISLIFMMKCTLNLFYMIRLFYQSHCMLNWETKTMFSTAKISQFCSLYMLFAACYSVFAVANLFYAFSIYPNWALYRFMHMILWPLFRIKAIGGWFVSYE